MCVGVSVWLVWSVSMLQAELQIEVQTENLCTSVKLFHCHLVVDKVALGQVFLRLSYATIILPVLRTHLHKRVAITRTNGRCLCIFQRNNALSGVGKHWIKNCFHYFSLRAV